MSTAPRQDDLTDRQAVTARLARHPLLAPLGPGVHAELAAAAELRRLDGGDQVEVADGALLVVEGTAVVRAFGTDRASNGAEIRLQPGDLCFAEHLFATDPSPAAARVSVVEGRCSALSLKPELVRQAVRDRPQLALLARPAVRRFFERAARLVEPDPEGLSALLSHLQPVEFTSGQILAEKRAIAEAFFVLLAGQLRRGLPGPDDAPRQLAPGDWFGETSLALGTGEAADVVALSDGVVLRLERARYRRLAERHPALRRFFAGLVAAEAAPAAGAHPPADATSKSATATEDDGGEIEQELLTPAGRPLGRALRAALRRYPLRHQPEQTDCGPACLGMVAESHGRKLRHARLRELCGVSQLGCSMLGLADAAEEIGFLARGVAAGFDDLGGVLLPAIAQVGSNHFVVVYEASRKHVILGDPAIGIRRLTRAEFEEMWDGALLLFRPVGQAPATAQPGEGRLARYVAYLRPHTGVLAEVLTAAFALQLLGLAMPFATQTVIDRVFVHREASLLVALLAALLAAAVFTSLISALRSLLLYDVVRRADRALVTDFHHRLFHLPLAFFAARKLGDLLVRFADNEKVRSFLVNLAVGAVLDVAMGLVYLIVLFAYDAKLAAIGLVPIPILVLLAAGITPVLRRVRRELVVRDGEAKSALVESLSAVATVKGNCSEANLRRRYCELFDRLLDSELKAVRLGTLSSSFGGLVTAGGQVLVLFVGAQHVLAGSLSLGAFVAFMALLNLVMAPALRLVGAWESFQETAVSLERLADVFEAEPEEPHASKLLKLPSIRGHLRMDEVTYRYERDLPPVLDRLSLEVLPGERVAVVGRSGAGKTTLVFLLLKLHAPESGTIQIDGHDLRSVSARSLRSQVGFVPQEISLFSGTIAENIAAGRDLSPEQLIRAAKSAGIHQAIVERPHGYETVVGERGSTRLAGGELQRLAIARALAGEPRMLLLDEPTSALDAESEAALLRTLHDEGGRRTIVMLAHRLGFARRADRIVVLDRGRLIEQGSHDQLLALDGLYAAFYREQVG